MTRSTAPAQATRYELGDVVVLTDVAPGYVGIIEQISHGNPTVYGVRSYDGTLYGRTADELLLADDDTAIQTRGDFRQLAERHEDLRGVVRVMSARDRARGYYFSTPESQRLDNVYAGVPLVLLASPERGGAMVLSTLDGRFEIVRLAGTEQYALVETARDAMARARRGGEQVFAGGSIYDCAALIASRLGIDAPTAAMSSSAAVERDAIRDEAAQYEQIRVWLFRHKLDGMSITAERVLAARAADEHEAYDAR